MRNCPLHLLILAGRTGPVFPEFAHGGLQLPFEHLQYHAFAFDLEAVQTETTLASSAYPPRPAYDVIQTALISPDNTVCMRCVLL